MMWCPLTVQVLDQDMENQSFPDIFLQGTDTKSDPQPNQNTINRPITEDTERWRILYTNTLNKNSETASNT